VGLGAGWDGEGSLMGVRWTSWGKDGFLGRMHRNTCPSLRSQAISAKARVNVGLWPSWDNQATTIAGQKSSLGTRHLHDDLRLPHLGNPPGARSISLRALACPCKWTCSRVCCWSIALWCCNSLNVNTRPAAAWTAGLRTTFTLYASTRCVREHVLATAQ